MMYWREQAIVVITVAILVLAVSSMNGSAVAQSPSVLPLGLGTLHWQLSHDAAAEALPAIKTNVPATADDPMTDQESYIIEPYVWKACKFRVTFYFAHDRLDAVGLDSRPRDAACRKDVEAELSATFGAEDHPAGVPQQTGHREWHDAQTRVVFNTLYGNDVDITLMQSGGPPLKIYD